jgi:hypothetical protein
MSSKRPPVGILKEKMAAVILNVTKVEHVPDIEYNFQTFFFLICHNVQRHSLEQKWNAGSV